MLSDVSTEELFEELKSRFTIVAFAGELNNDFTVILNGNTSEVLFLNAVIGKAIVDEVEDADDNLN